ncbi:carboxypeptidase M32 [Dictyobacter vulcani]|uniref:Metal-dependent carboxypeptidase n=1 Tax=Dictyobacter vulcani TaxID=2607529 RepID=A0A5J4KPT8_9CHLR|nr:carboxypeptidase M32 [Dictyobacter vulcani]GER91394.1 carboxypeptidase M32 [Dictyobacter vulcani]
MTLASKSTISFTTQNTYLNALLEYLHPIGDLEALLALASWDQQTAMPAEAGVMRMHQVAILESIIHERLTAQEMGTLLSNAEKAASQESFTDADRGLLRQTRRTYDHATKLPKSLVEEKARLRSESVDAWQKSRANNDFALFAPFLQRTIALKREVAERIGYTEFPYDALLDDFEPGLTTRKVEAMFQSVRAVSTSLLQRIQQSGQTIDASSLYGHFAPEQQHTLSDQLLRVIGYDFSRGQLARSQHPFTTDFGAPFDVRVTNRYDEQYLPMGIMAGMHEGGHGLYAQGISPALARTALANGASLGIHESQSRLWENAIGRSSAFWQAHYGLLQQAFPEHFKDIEQAIFVRALNTVKPSLIRVMADEVTYNLHILIRFELEKGLVNGEFAVESLPRLWNERYQQYLGITPPTETEGVLQDVHWTSQFGYFPTYTLGNLYSAQILHTLQQTFPDFQEQLATGDTSFILTWLREHIHQYGVIYQPEELIQRATGEAPNPQYFVDYLTNKFESVYNLPPEQVNN